MIRIRKTTGITESLTPEDRFLELLTVDGSLAAVVYLDDAGALNTLLPESEEFDKYSEVFHISKKNSRTRSIENV